MTNTREQALAAGWKLALAVAEIETDDATKRQSALRAFTQAVEAMDGRRTVMIHEYPHQQRPRPGDDAGFVSVDLEGP